MKNFFDASKFSPLTLAIGFTVIAGIVMSMLVKPAMAAGIAIGGGIMIYRWSKKQQATGDTPES